MSIWPLKPSEAADLIASQGYVCAICGDKPLDGKRLVIDHCHTTGTVRGALCEACNCGLGFFRDSTRSLLAAVGYLERARLAAEGDIDERARAAKRRLGMGNRF